MYICKICNNEYEDLLSFSKHINMKHRYEGGLIKYYVDYENFIIPKCSCGKNSKSLKGLEFRKTCGDKECLTKIKKNIKLTIENKIRISDSLKKSHKDGNHPGWSFINNDINRRSYPEKWFIKNVLNKYDLYSKYKIVEKLSFGKYFLDFAIIDLKIDIEIDGQQHFRNNENINHDILRDNFLLKNGWKVYRLAWVEIKNNPNEKIENFLKWLEDKQKYRKYNIIDIKNQFKKKLKYGSREKYFEKMKEMSYERNKNIIKMIENSDIDFSKFGWAKKISTLTGMKNQNINRWIKKYMNDFYNTKCYKMKK